MNTNNSTQMNPTSLLTSDETLDGYSQTDLDANRENSFEVIHMDNSNSSDVDRYSHQTSVFTHPYSIPIVKRKREDNPHRVDKR